MRTLAFLMTSALTACSNTTAGRSTTLSDSPRISAERVVVERWRMKPPDDYEAPPPVRLTPEVTALPNGLRVVLLRRPSWPVVRVALAVRGGSATDSPRTRGMTSLMYRLLPGLSRDEKTLERLNEIGGRIWSQVHQDRGVLWAIGPTDQTEGLVDALSSIALRPKWETKSVRGSVRQYANALELALQRPRLRAQSLLPTLLYESSSPCGHPTFGAPVGIRRIRVSQLETHHSKWITPSGSVLIVAGDVERDRLMAIVRSKFADWKAPSERPQPPRCGKSPPPSVQVIERPGRSMTTVIATRALDVTDDNTVDALDAHVRSMASGLSSSLNVAVRREGGYSYGARGAVIRSSDGVRVHIELDVVARETSRALADLVRVLRAPQATGVQPKATDESVESRMDRIALRLLDDMSLEEATTPDETVNLNEALTPDRVSFLLIGDPTRIDEALTATPLGSSQRMVPKSGKITPGR